MDRIITWTNRLGLFSVIILTYWVFCTISISVFGLKVFRENITQAFFLSIFGIISLMAGCLMLNIMINLTSISNSLRNHAQPTNDVLTGNNGNRSFFVIFCFLISFPLLFGMLYAGDHLTEKQKEKYILHSAERLIKDYAVPIEQISQYSFSKEYLASLNDSLILMQTDESFPSVSLIVQDKINNQNVFLKFGVRHGSNLLKEKDENLNKTEHIAHTSSEERDYLDSVFKNGNTQHRYSAHDGNYELYYPVKTKSGVIVLYLREYAAYGKIGS